ncbi:hypothetical protein PENSPDRAFT_680223 [Peniophora sp. CONT]|nr:hypothetical protein PENSPDRAFT_680223 [Peniophora sp. CONT]
MTRFCRTACFSEWLKANLKDTKAELNAVRAANDVLHADMSSLQARKDELQTTVNNAHRVIEQGTQCPVCNDTYKDPVVECGHTLCLRCATNWFATAYNALRTEVQGDIPALVPPVHPAQMEGWPRRLIHAVEHFDADTVRPKFTCPVCRGAILRAPVRNYAIAYIVSLATSTEQFGPSQRRRACEKLMDKFFRDTPSL